MQDETKLLIQLDKFKSYPLLENNNINIPIQKGSIWYERFAAEERSWNNASITYFNCSVDNSILDSEVKACVIISIPRIEITFDNDHIRVLHDLPKRYIYIY